MKDEATFMVVVEFDTRPENQEQALAEIGDYVAQFLSRQDGFVRSFLSRSDDGAQLVHCALWRSEADFDAAGVKAREHPAMPRLRQYEPRGRRFRLWGAFGQA